MFDFGSFCVRILMKTAFTFLVVMISFFNLFAEDDDKGSLLSTKMNTSAEKTEIFDKEECYPLEESYKKFVFEARYLIMEGKDRYVKRYFEKHLVCWNDKDVYNEFAEFYIKEEKLYLAALTYKKAGLHEEYNKVKELRNNIKDNEFEILAKRESEKYKKSYRNKKAVANTMMSLGPVIAGVGFGLLIHDLAGGTNSKIAQFSLMIGGFSIIAGGTVVNLSAINSLNTSLSYRNISEEYKGDNGTLPSEYYQYSGFERETKKMSAQSYRKHGGTLISISVPLLAIAVYGLYESYNFHFKNNNNDDDNGGDMLLLSGIAFAIQILSLAPSIASLTGGIILLAKASKWEKLSTEPNLLTLNSIAPIIDPVSKTYGLSMGFSF